MNKYVFMLKNLSKVMRLALYANFPKLYPRLAPKVIVASCKITENCNSKCKGCNFHKTTTKDMTYDEWTTVFDQLKQNEIKLVRFSGGEPMLRKDIFELFGYVKKIGLNVSIQSNILLLDEQKIARMADLGVDKIAVSVDGVGKDYETYRGVDSFSTVEKVLVSLKKHFNGRVGITPTIMDTSQRDLYDVLEFAKQIKIPVVAFNLVNFTHYFYKDEDEYNKKSYDNVDRKELRKFLGFVYGRVGKYLKIKKYDLYAIHRYFEDYMLTDLPCLNPFYKICIGSTGNIYGCCSQDPYGNILKTPLKELFKTEQFRKVALSALERTCPGCNCGLTLNSRMNLKYRAMPYLTNFMD